ncbi:hypothetical protein MYOV003v1_p0075 [Vibrio phage 207E48.1]|nr:hypothetical protein MYOV003v1_p0075 [Vibrio phage 207E48.1]
MKISNALHQSLLRDKVKVMYHIQVNDLRGYLRESKYQIDFNTKLNRPERVARHTETYMSIARQINMNLEVNIDFDAKEFQ